MVGRIAGGQIEEEKARVECSRSDGEIGDLAQAAGTNGPSREDQRTAADRTCGENAAGQRCSAVIGVVSRKEEGAGIGFRQAADTGDVTGDGELDGCIIRKNVK